MREQKTLTPRSIKHYDEKTISSPSSQRSIW